MRKPTAAQRKWLSRIANAAFILERTVSMATIRACEHAGWVGVDGHGNPRLTALGRAAIEGTEP